MRLTRDLPGIGGQIKQHPEDFRVEELALEPCSGRGEHLYLRIEKRSLTTEEAVALVARGLGIPEREVGHAGRKDARAVTSQWLSVPLRTRARLGQLGEPGLRVLEEGLHHRKLRLGQLQGNRFDLLIRGVASDAEQRARPVLEVLRRRGVPNAFGAQRFGTRADNDRVGRAILQRDWDEALRLLVGAPSDREGDPRVQEARRLFDEGRPGRALELWPRALRAERGVLRRYLQRGDARAAVAALGQRRRRFLFSAYQARLFNRCLERRLPDLDRLLEGDVAIEHHGDLEFLVEERDAEQVRADRFEISPAGPLFGPRLRRARGAAAASEEEVFREEGLDLASAGPGLRDLRGERRPYRFPLLDLSLATEADGLRLRFRLPPGCYATTVLDEVQKNDGPAG